MRFDRDRPRTNSGPGDWRGAEGCDGERSDRDRVNPNSGKLAHKRDDLNGTRSADFIRASGYHAAKQAGHMTAPDQFAGTSQKP